MDQHKLILRDFDEKLTQKVEKSLINEIYNQFDEVKEAENKLVSMNKDMKDTIQVN